MTIDVATGIVRILKQEGVDWVSTFPVCRVNNALGREGVPMLMMRDDRYAVAVADAFSRITAGSRIGVCTFQGGVNAAGMQYAYAGLAQAYEDGSPVLCITDGVPAGASGNSQYDVASAMKTVSKWFGYIDKPERTPEFMRRAFTMLRSGRPGPVILAVPNATATYDETADPYHPVKGWKSAPDPADVSAAVDALLGCPRPADLRRRGGHLRGRLGRPESVRRTRECAGHHDAQGQRGVPGGPSAVCRRARRSDRTLSEQERRHPRRRLEPVAGPLQPRHSRSGEEDHHPLQHRRAAHQQDVSHGARGDRRCAPDLAGAPPGGVRPHVGCRTARRAMWRRK